MAERAGEWGGGAAGGGGGRARPDRGASGTARARGGGEPRVGGAPGQGPAGADRAGAGCERAGGRQPRRICSTPGASPRGRRSISTDSCARPRTPTGTWWAGPWGRWTRASCRCRAATRRWPTSSGSARSPVTPERWRMRTRDCGSGRPGSRSGASVPGTSGSGRCPRPPPAPSRWTSRSGSSSCSREGWRARTLPAASSRRAARCTSPRWSRRPRWSTAGWEIGRWWPHRAGWCAGCSGASGGCGRRSVSGGRRRARWREWGRWRRSRRCGPSRRCSRISARWRRRA